MPNKQNNDGSQKSSTILSHEPPTITKSNPLPEEKLNSVSYADSITFKQASVSLPQKVSVSQHGKEKPQTKSLSVTTSIIREVSATLPIMIYELQEKTLNEYLRQFLQINTFQSTQKGKQLIDLIKQSPSCKQSIRAINKVFKLFKSSLPEATLCSFQFIRDLIQIDSQKIVEMVQQALLMPIVEIIEYRSYVPNMDRGNTYFLGALNRYATDEKINHLIKIGSTFFKMIHQALYVWGTFYFPSSNFNKMLNKLMNSSKITFPSYPDQFKFYSQTRMNLFLETLKLKTKESVQKIKTQIKNKLKNTQNVNKLQQIQNKINKSEIQIKSQEQQKQFKDVVSQKKQENEELQFIELMKKPTSTKQVSEKKEGELIKKIKPTKIKQKKSSFQVQKTQIKSQKKIDFSKLDDIEDPLNLLGQKQNKQMEEINQVNSYEVKQVQPKTLQMKQGLVQQVHQTKLQQQKSKKPSIPKQSLKIDLKKLNGRQKVKLSSEVLIEQKIEQKVSFKQEHTFRPNEEQKMVQFNKKQHINHQSEQQSETVRFQSTERQRFNYSMTDESQDRAKNTLIKDKSNSNSDRLPQTNLITELFRKQFDNLKNTLVYEIKKDILSSINSNHQNNHVNFDKQNNDPFSGRFGEKPEGQIQPSTQAMQFIKKKLTNKKKIRAVSKYKRNSVLKDLLPDEKENNEQINTIQNQRIDSGVNTDELTNQKIYEQIQSLNEKLYLLKGYQNSMNKKSLSNKRQNALISSKLHSNSFAQTPYTINKNQEDNLKSSQFTSLRSTCTSLRKRSNSKLSERRSSVESLVMQKALSKPESCHNQLQEIFGGPNTLLFNAALNSVRKKRPSIMFC